MSTIVLVDSIERSIGRLADAISDNNKRKRARSRSPDDDRDYRELVAKRMNSFSNYIERLEGGLAKILDKLDKI